MKVVLAIDSFKGCLSSADANAAAAVGVRRAVPCAEVMTLPVSDGGEGWIEAFRASSGGTYATSYGTGQLVLDAVRRGCKEIVVGLGGSATSDAGRGMIQALCDAFPEWCPTDGAARHSVLGAVRFTLATDVTNPLYGPNGAAQVFGPQKGATKEMVAELDRRARCFAAETACKMGFDCASEPGAGAAGGLGYAFMQFLRAECRSGIDLLLDVARYETLLKEADVVFTGEGAADRQTLMGKVPFGILRSTLPKGIPTLLIAGQMSDAPCLLSAGFACAESINPPGYPLEKAMQPDICRQHITEKVEELIRSAGCGRRCPRPSVARGGK